MAILKIGSYIILACFLLSFIPAAAAANAPLSFSPETPEEKALREKQIDDFRGIPALLKKPKFQWTADDWMSAGLAATSKDNPEEAVNCFNKAEEIVLLTDPKHKKEATLGALSELEDYKSKAYAGWPGHDLEGKRAFLKSQEFSNAIPQDPNAGFLDNCLIATATFESPMAPQVQQLREFREGNIYSTKSGTQFMTAFNAWYYSFSPAVAIFIDQHPSTKAPMRIILTPLLGILTFAKMSFFALAFNPDIAVIVSGFIASTLIGLVYVFPLFFVLLVMIRRVYPFTFNTGVFKILVGFAATGFVLLAVGGLLLVKPVLLVGSVLFIVSLVLITGLLMSWVCMNRLDLWSGHVNND